MKRTKIYKRGQIGSTDLFKVYFLISGAHKHKLFEKATLQRLHLNATLSNETFSFPTKKNESLFDGFVAKWALKNANKLCQNLRFKNQTVSAAL